MTATTPARPALWPALRWVRWALLLLLAFAFVRGELFAATTPSFWGPDEDYHMMYVDHVAKSGTIIDPDKPLYSDEYIETTNRTQFNAYGVGPRLDFSGDPKAVLHQLAHLPSNARDQRHTGRDPAVVHAPLYYYGGAIFDEASWVLDGKAMPTRMFWTRTWSALLGVLAVFAAWLLARQVFSGERRALLVALLVATQPMISYWSGLVSNDIGVIATYTLTLAMLAFMLRTPPAKQQGYWLGGAIALAILTKSTSLTLGPLAVAVWVAQGLVHRGSWPEVRRSVLAAATVVAAPALAWYLWTKIAYGTFTGEVLVGGVATSGAPSGQSAGFGLHDYVNAARNWFADIYRTSWFHFINYEAPRGRWVYFAPGAVIAVGALGALGFAVDARRTLRDPSRPQLRQALLLLAACALITAPFLRLDLSRAASGVGFLVNGGRFLLPTYAGFAVVMVLGLDWLLSDRARRFALGALGVMSVVLVFHVWQIHFVARYYGDGSWAERFHRMSFDRPWFIVPATYWLALAALAGLIAAFGVIVWRGRLPRERGAQA